MTVSKRLRYEVLRRDNHQCRYCGGTAPDVTLTVDHVVPVALGGTDAPNNLVAACRDCNGGKSASSPDAALVEQVSDDAIRWASAMKQAAVEERALRDSQLNAYDAVAAAWRPRYLPNGWQASVNAVLSAGLELSDILELIDVALTAQNVDNRWRYFCGCCWKRLKRMQERAQEIVSGHGAPPYDEDPPDVERDWLEERMEKAQRRSIWHGEVLWNFRLRLSEEWYERFGNDIAYPYCMCGFADQFCGDWTCMAVFIGYVDAVLHDANGGLNASWLGYRSRPDAEMITMQPTPVGAHAT